ncbi:hypothetical protein [Kytococcus sedentarius]|uniref:hypothetical protein n=1 Tax=Kytococcus sedentarius TaxID=1276 RepID=UPI00195029D9|nr:hypothetical protein [Kytococcus sedentarius]QRO86558.1 hypothetical protein I6J30_06605 [Kytococcus sedentarius]
MTSLLHHPIRWSLALLPGLALVAASVLWPGADDWRREGLWSLLQWQSQVILLAPVLGALAAALTQQQRRAGRGVWLASTLRPSLPLWLITAVCVAVGGLVLVLSLVVVAVVARDPLAAGDVVGAAVGVAPVVVVAVLVGVLVGRFVPSWAAVPLVLVVLWAWGVGILSLPAGFWAVGGAGQSVEGKVLNAARSLHRWLALGAWLALAAALVTHRPLSLLRSTVGVVAGVLVVWAMFFSGWFDATHAETRVDPAARASECTSVQGVKVCTMPGHASSLDEAAPVAAAVARAIPAAGGPQLRAVREVTPWERQEHVVPQDEGRFHLDLGPVSGPLVAGSIVVPEYCERTLSGGPADGEQVHAEIALRAWAASAAGFDLPLHGVAGERWQRLGEDERAQWLEQALPASLSCEALPSLPRGGGGQ